MLNSAEHEIFLLLNSDFWYFKVYGQKNSILGLSEPENADIPDIFTLMTILNFMLN